MSLGVPIYSFFRTHAHMRSFKELMVDAEVETTIRVGWVVALVLISSVLDGLSFGLTGGFGNSSTVTRGTTVLSALLVIASVAIACGLLLHVQANLNRLWERVKGARQIDPGIGVDEVIPIVIGILAWLGTIASVVSSP